MHLQQALAVAAVVPSCRSVRIRIFPYCWRCWPSQDTGSVAVWFAEVVRADYRLLAAVIVPLLVWPWIPPWEDSILEEGLPGATMLCVSFAVLEEVLFRGGIQGWLLTRARFRKNVLRLSRANWLTSLIFAAAHVWQHPLALVPGYLAVSLMLGYFRERYNGILVPVVLHAWYNLALLFLPVLFSS